MKLEDRRKMYVRWKNMRRNRDGSWENFQAFVEDVCKDGVGEILSRPDRTKPFGRDNFKWITIDESYNGENNPNYRAASKETTCKLCGVPIVSHLSVPRIYCSQECRYADRKSGRICVQCGVTYTPECKASTKYCSDVCELEAFTEKELKIVNKQRTINENVDQRQRVKTITFCKVCGKRMEVYRSGLSKGRYKFCSRDCYARAVGLRQQGDKHHNWKGGVNKTRDVIRRHPLYSSWRKDVFSRDDYTCQSCFARGGKLHAHHVVAYKDDPKLRLKISNGITLCDDCHRQWHIFDRAGLFSGLEKAFQTKAKKAFEAAGFYVFNVHGGPYQTAGIPDLLMCFCGRFVAVELKVFPNFVTRIQKLQMDLMKEAGGLVYMARSEDDIERIINEVRNVALPESDLTIEGE